MHEAGIRAPGGGEGIDVIERIAGGKIYGYVGVEAVRLLRVMAGRYMGGVGGWERHGQHLLTAVL